MSVIRTSIDAKLKSRTLWRGTAWAFVGIALIFFFGIRGVPPWGILVLLIGLGLIAKGIVPYRKLTRMEEHPDEIHIEGDLLLYVHRGVPIARIATPTIKRVFYRNGIGLEMEGGRHLFFPHFTEKSFLLLQTRLDDVVELDEA